MEKIYDYNGSEVCRCELCGTLFKVSPDTIKCPICGGYLYNNLNKDNYEKI